MTKAEKKVIGYINRHVLVFGFIAVSVIAFMIRFSFFPQRSSDWQIFIADWINKLIEHPGLSGIGENIGEYNVPYMLFLNIVAKTPFEDLYEVKLFSILFDYLLAAAAAVTVWRNIGRKAPGVCLAVYAAILMSPVTYMDSAWWSQCDSIYTFGIVMSLLSITREKYGWSWFWFGIAFSFKLQAVFFLPVLLVCYIASRKMSIINVLTAAGVFCVLLIPALIAGRGLKDTFGIYVAQTGYYGSLTLNMPNLHSILTGDAIDMFQPAAIYLTVGVLGTAACLFIKRGYHTPYAYVTLAFWTLMTCVFLLPSMHERYVYPACMLSIIWAAFGKRKYDIAVAAAVNGVAVRGWMSYMFNTKMNFVLLAFVNLAVVVLITARLFSLREKPAAEEISAEAPAEDIPPAEPVCAPAVDTAQAETIPAVEETPEEIPAEI